MFVCCECCVLSGSLCDELITRPEESCRLWCVVVCDLETSRMKRPWHALGRSATAKKKKKMKEAGKVNCWTVLSQWMQLCNFKCKGRLFVCWEVLTGSARYNLGFW